MIFFIGSFNLTCKLLADNIRSFSVSLFFCMINFFFHCLTHGV